MQKLIFDLQRFAQVLVGTSSGNALTVTTDKTQAYGLAGNDTLVSSGKDDAQLIGGSGDDVLSMTGGNGTLTGGTGSDTFNLSYSADQTISAVIEDIDPTNDKIIITYGGNATPQLDSVVSGSDVVWTDSSGYFNLTLKGSNDASDYYDGTANSYLWDVLRLTNQEREDQGLSPLVMSDALTYSASIRTEEIVEQFSHTRPDGSSCFTAVEKSYNTMGENIAAGQNSPASVMTAWMNSEGHKANILTSNFKKLGVGYIYNSSGEYNYYWVQMFGGNLMSPDSVSTDDILSTQMQIKTGEISSANLITLTEGNDSYNNTVEGVTIQALGGADSIDNYANSVSIDAGDGNDEIDNDGSQVTISGGAGNDDIDNDANNVTIDGGDGMDEISNEGSNVAINGGAGNDEIDNDGSNVTIDGGDGNDDIDNENGANVTFKYSAGDDTIEGFNSTSKLVISSDEYSSVRSGNNVIFTTNNGSIILRNAASLSNFNIVNDTSTVDDSSDSAVTLGTDVEVFDASGRKKKIKITGNELDNSIIGGKGKDTLDGAEGDDTLTGGKGNDVFIYNSGDDLITDYTAKDKISVASAYTDYEINGSDLIFDFGDNDSLTIADGASIAVNLNSKVNYYTADGIIDKKKKSIVLDAEAESFDASKSKNYSKLVTIDGAAVEDEIEIIGNKKSNKIYAGNFGSIINGGKGNDTLTGDEGEDIFIYENKSGKDVISNYGEGDIISLGSGATIKDALMKGSNAVIKIGSGSITVKNTSEFTLVQGENETIFSGGVFIDEENSVAKVYGSFKGTIDLSKYDVTTADASTSKKSVTIQGGIYDDTLWGGKGNDLLYGGEGDDNFIYAKGGGKDTISGFEDGDALTLDGLNLTGATLNNAGTEIYLKVGSTSKAITLKDFSATSFNINGEIYTVSDKTLVKK